MSHVKGYLCLLLILILQACGLETVLEPPQMPTQPLCNDVLDDCVAVKEAFYVDKRNHMIHAHGLPTSVRGINWFGLEGEYLGLHGLWSGRSLESIVDQVHQIGFNALRVPLAPESLNAKIPGKDGYSSPLDQLKKLLAYTKTKKEMYVLLDLHTCSHRLSHTDKPGPGVGSCANYSVERWIEDLKTLAQLSLSYDNVMGIDLFNEPYGLTWDQWRVMAERAGAEILKINPKILIFVEGVGNESPRGKQYAFWGENLTEAIAKPIRLPRTQVVLSPHVYGPSVAMQDYFLTPDFPTNMDAIWEEHFGYIKKQEDFAVIIGEWGGRFEGLDQVWGEAFVNYLRKKSLTNTFFWSLNPNSGDTGGLLEDDWKTVNTRKLKLIERLRWK